MKLTFPYKMLKKDEYPELNAVIEKQKNNFGLGNVKSYIWLWHWPWGVNAMATSFFGDKMIITREILEIMSLDEMECIIAHEFSHLYNRDMLMSRTVRLLFNSPFILAFCLYYAARYYNVIKNLGIQLIISILILLALPGWIFGFKIDNWLSVELETRADRDAVLKTKNSDAFERSLIKLYNNKFKNDKRPSQLSVINDTIDYIFRYFLGFTHPGIKTRVENIEFSKKLIEASTESTSSPVIIQN